MTRRHEDFESLSEAVASGRRIDWTVAELTAADSVDRRLIRQLALLARVAAACRIQSDADPTLPSATWGHLRLLGRIGAGSYGEVFRAWDENLDQEVALKLYWPAAEASSVQRTALLEEARTLAKVRSPNVVRVLGADLHQGRVGFWMDLLAGQPVSSDVAASPPPTVPDVLAIGIAVCRGLAAIHRAGVVHGDIKPANVLREPGGRVCLVDLGAGAAIRNSVSRTGTPLYMAPEAFLNGEVSPQSDLYSVGVLLFSLLTGALPVTADTHDELERHHRAANRRSVREARPEVPAAVCRIIDRCLAPDPADRFESAAALEAALSELTSSRHDRTWKTVMSILLVGAVASAGILVVLKSPWGDSVRGRQTPAILIYPLQVGGVADTTQYLSRAFAEALAADLSQASGLRVLPVPEGVSSGALPADQLRRARRSGAAYAVLGSLRCGEPVTQASLSLIDTKRERVLAGTQQETRTADFQSLAAQASAALLQRLGLAVPARYTTSEEFQGSPDLVGSQDWSEAIGSLARSEHQVALQATARLIAQFPREPEAWVLRCQALMDAGALPNDPALEHLALAALDSLEALDPNHPRVVHWRLDIPRRWDEASEPKRFQADLTRLLRRVDLSPALRVSILESRWRIDRGESFSKGRATLEEALRLQPARASTLRGLSTSLLDSGRAAEAEVRARQAVALDPMNVANLSTLGDVLEAQGRWQEAATIHRSAYSRARNPDTALSLARALMRGGVPIEASAWLDSVRQFPKTVSGTYNLACYHAVTGDRDAAIQEVQWVVDHGWNSWLLTTDPDFNSIRDDPRFQNILARLRTPEEHAPGVPDSVRRQ